MHPYHALTMRKSASAPAPTIPPTFNVRAITALEEGSQLQPTASYSINSDGSCVGSTEYSPGSWITPVGGSYGSSYWVIVTLTTGTVTSGTTGSRVQIGTGKTWTCTTTGAGAFREKSAFGTIEIWDAASGGNKVASGTFEIIAQVG